MIASRARGTAAFPVWLVISETFLSAAAPAGWTELYFPRPMKPLALAVVFAIAASWAGPADCTPDCCRAADGSAMASCPMRGSSSECQFRECSPEGSATQPVSVHFAVLTDGSMPLALLASGEAPVRPAPRIAAAQRDPLVPPPRA